MCTKDDLSNSVVVFTQVTDQCHIRKTELQRKGDLMSANNADAI